MINKKEFYGECIFDDNGKEFKEIIKAVIKKTYKNAFIDQTDMIEYENR